LQHTAAAAEAGAYERVGQQEKAVLMSGGGKPEEEKVIINQ